MPAADAVVVDTSELSIDEVVKQVMALARSRFDVIG
jgi:cytidylate kinase